MSKKIFGKYRGTVLHNVDPIAIGRLQVSVPDVSELTASEWAMPCFPCAGPHMGIWALPSIGAGVWVEFEQGDLTKPVWSGCWYARSADVPPQAHGAGSANSTIVLQTAGQNSISISDAPGPAGGVHIKTATGAMLSINDAGITIANGKGAVIAMNGPAVTINNGALAII